MHAYDVNGNFRWKVDLGRIDVGAYDIPTFEWGPASSPIIWNGLVILQCDTQADSFLLALNADTGETVWKTEREELPSWGTPTVATTRAGPSCHQRVELHPRLRSANRQGAVAARRQLEDHGADADLRRRPVRRRERPRAGAADLRGPPGRARRLTLRGREDQQRRRRVEPDGPRVRTCRRRSIYQGLLYVLANNGVFDAYDLKTGEEVYRQRLPAVGNGFSASPVAADGKIYLSNEDGDIIVVAAGPRVQAPRDQPDGRAADGDAGAVRRRDVRPHAPESVCRGTRTVRPEVEAVSKPLVASGFSRTMAVLKPLVESEGVGLPASAREGKGELRRGSTKRRRREVGRPAQAGSKDPLHQHKPRRGLKARPTSTQVPSSIVPQRCGRVHGSNPDCRHEARHKGNRQQQRSNRGKCRNVRADARRDSPEHRQQAQCGNRPRPRPIAARRAPRTSTRRASAAGSDPRASRTANSRLREVTPHQITPVQPDGGQHQRERGDSPMSHRYRFSSQSESDTTRSIDFTSKIARIGLTSVQLHVPRAPSPPARPTC